VLLHPSPEIVLPSSHVSGAVIIEFPQIVVQTVAFDPTQEYPAAGPVFVGLHPGAAPASHVSKPTDKPSFAIGVQVEGIIKFEQAHPVSTVQVAEHPSPAAIPLSSQVSGAIMIPSPQTMVHTEAEAELPGVQVYPTADPIHPRLQPIPLFEPSSHVSVGDITNPSPQIGIQAVGLGAVVVQVQPGSKVQVAEHPSPATVPPSSQTSGASTSPFPQIPVHIEGEEVLPAVQV
jgi:hypothetical protein